MKYKSSYRHCRLVTVEKEKKLGVINSFRAGYVSSLDCSLFPLFSLFSGEGKPHFYFCCTQAVSILSDELLTKLTMSLMIKGSWPLNANQLFNLVLN